MKKVFSFLLAVVILLAVHEGMHAVVAALYGEYESLHARPPGFFEVEYRTPVDEREGIPWAFISGAANLATLLLGYGLLMYGDRIAQVRSSFLKSTLFYLTLVSLLADPLNLSIGPFFYGGDANGIATGLGVNRYIIQAVFLVILLVNRELVARKLFPAPFGYGRMLTYQPATAEKIDEFLHLMRVEGADYLNRTMELMQMTWSQFAHLVRTVGRVFAIYRDGEQVGFYWIEERGRIVHLHGLFITEACQGQGIGTEVMTMLAHRYADTMGAIELGVHESNTRARALYERLGYRVVKYLADLGFYILQYAFSEKRSAPGSPETAGC